MSKLASAHAQHVSLCSYAISGRVQTESCIGKRDSDRCYPSQMGWAAKEPDRLRLLRSSRDCDTQAAAASSQSSRLCDINTGSVMYRSRFCAILAVSLAQITRKASFSAGSTPQAHNEHLYMQITGARTINIRRRDGPEGGYCTGPGRVGTSGVARHKEGTG